MSSKLSSRVLTFEKAVDVAHEIIHGNDKTVVQTEGGPVRSFAKAIKDLGVDANLQYGDIVGARADAMDAASAAQGALAMAQSIIGAAQAFAEIFSTLAEGLAASDATSGPASYFKVRRMGADGLPRTSLYQRNSSELYTLIDSYVASAEFDDALPHARVNAGYVPLVEDEAGNVPLWLDHGKLNALGLSDDLIALIGPLLGLIRASGSKGNAPLFVDDEDNVPVWIEGGKLAAIGIADTLIESIASAVGFVRASTGSRSVPLYIDTAESIPVWLDDGNLDARGLGPTLSGVIVSLLEHEIASRCAPRSSPKSSSLPTCTDGRSLNQWRAKLAKLERTGSGIVRVLFDGDSWSERDVIPKQMANVLHAKYGKSGDGHISVNGYQLLSGISMARNNWKLWDASSGAELTPHGSGIDGHAIYTTATNATVSIHGVVATELYIYFQEGDGAFRWRVDGGAWTAVAGARTQALGIVAIAGLLDGPHSLEIDTDGNEGTAVLWGFRAARSAVPGIEVHKCGNSSLDGLQWKTFMAHIPAVAADVKPDVVITSLGTNDYRRATCSPAALVAAHRAKVAAYRSVCPGVSFIFFAPADSIAAAVIPLSTYRDAIYEMCVSDGHEFYNMHDDWVGHAEENALGMWADTLHLNDNGALRLSRRIESLLLQP